VNVDLFETAVVQSLGLPSQRCITAEFCGKGIAVRAQRRRVLVRPLRVSRLPGRQHPGDTPCTGKNPIRPGPLTNRSPRSPACLRGARDRQEGRGMWGAPAIWVLPVVFGLAGGANPLDLRRIHLVVLLRLGIH
jgi:hypothetical protein